MLTHVGRSKHVASGVLRCSYRAYSQTTPLLRRQPPILEGRHTRPKDSPLSEVPNKSPYCFETGYSAFAKRLSRPFPPPFLSKPSGSFSDPLTTHNRAQYRHPQVDGQQLRGITNGDDAIIIGGQNFLAVNDGVGAWAQKDRGHAALWSRLIAHYWAAEVEKSLESKDVSLEKLNPIACLQIAYNKTKEATSTPNEILGTTTATSVLLHHRSKDEPVVLATTLGDCAVLIIRPEGKKILYKSTEQWHWFDCPRQLGTNSPDTPDEIAVTDVVDVQEGDVIVLMSDGVTDNLWEHEICEKVCTALQQWKDGDKAAEDGMVYIARQLMTAARTIAQDPYAESPYMERALDEGIAAEGGKLDDISVIVGLCKRSTD